MKDNPLVSVVIPTYNSEKTLPKCLESIKNQTYKNIEVIVVDKFSVDRTVGNAKKFNTKIIQSNAEMSKARNIGLSKTHKNSIYAFFIDSDMELDCKVIEESVKLLKSNNRIGGLIIPEESVGNTFISKIRYFERSFYEGTEIEAARFFRKELVERVGGYDEDIIFYEDHTVPQKIEKLGFDIKARISSKIFHHENISIDKWLKKKYYYGETAYKYKERYYQHTTQQIGFFYRYSIFLLNKRFYSKPSLALGVLILKLLEYIAAGLGYIARKKERDEII